MDQKYQIQVSFKKGRKITTLHFACSQISENLNFKFYLNLFLKMPFPLYQSFIIGMGKIFFLANTCFLNTCFLLYRENSRKS